MDEESATSRASYACFQIGVENRDYHYLSQSEIAGGTRNDADVPIHAVLLGALTALPESDSDRRVGLGDRSEMLVELCGLGCFLGPQKFLHEKTNGRRDT
jgi:hypothetical protein